MMLAGKVALVTDGAFGCFTASRMAGGARSCLFQTKTAEAPGSLPPPFCRRA